MESQRPFTFDIVQAGRIRLGRYDRHIVRRLSDLRGQFLDPVAYTARLSVENPLLYEVYEIRRPEVAGELLCGLSIVHPGIIGEEYFMTKGHFHTELYTAEVYYGLKGSGLMVMETPDGEWAVEPLQRDKVLYVPPGWAHRSVNTGSQEDLVTYFAYPGNAGHDYGSIERQGFRKRVVARDGAPLVIDNPRWVPPGERS